MIVYAQLILVSSVVLIMSLLFLNRRFETLEWSRLEHTQRTRQVLCCVSEITLI